MNQPSEVEITTEDGKRLETVYFGPGELTATVALKDLSKIKSSKDMFRIFLNNSHFAQISQPNYAIIHMKKYINYTILSSVYGEPFSGNEYSVTFTN